jgi:hypothetical protein
LLAFLAPLGAHADGRSYRNDALKVRAFAPPLGWEAQDTRSYARLLALYSNKEGDKLTLVAARVPATMNVRALANESRAALVRQGWKNIVETSDKSPLGAETRVHLDARLDDGHKLARQLYVVNEGIGYVVTMIGAMTRAPQLGRDFDEAVQSLDIGSEPRSSDAPVDVKR